MRWRRRNGADVRKHLLACRDDLVALQRDARNLANDFTEVTRDGAGRAAKQASTALDYVSGQLNGRSGLALAGAGAIIGALLTRR
jgi:hypothetical protein